MTTTNNSIYICGPVSGTDDYVERFTTAEKNLRQTSDFKIINPVHLLEYKYKNPEEIEWNELMLNCLEWLSCCTHIYLMSGWEKSHGARIEQLWAEKLDLIEIREIPKTDGHFCELYKKECIKNFGKKCQFTCSRN